MKNSLSIAAKAAPLALIVVLIKGAIIFQFFGNWNVLQIFQINEIGVLFTGGFFVMGFMLAGTLSDLKESEKIPGELATNLEIIKEIIIDDVKSNQKNRLTLLSSYISDIIYWLNDKEKHSRDIFSVVDEIHLNLKPTNKDLDRRFFEQLTAIRRLINRTYIISRTTFAQPAYILQRAIVTIISVLVLLCEFKTTGSALIVTFSLTFIFFYLLFLVREFDDPFRTLKSKTYVDLKSLENVNIRVREVCQKL